MVDRITGNKGFGPLANIGRADKSGQTKKSDSAKNSDRVDFSSALQNATKVQEPSAAQDAARTEKIQALKAQIENGTYKPDLEKVASSLLPFIMKDS